jgi:hypothetical protein
MLGALHLLQQLVELALQSREIGRLLPGERLVLLN